MFAYCLNNPAFAKDSTGKTRDGIIIDIFEWFIEAFNEAVQEAGPDFLVAFCLILFGGVIDYFSDGYSVPVVPADTIPSSASDYLESEVEPIETQSVSTTVTLASPHRKTNGSKTRTNDKHTGVRSGSQKNRAKQKSGWKYRGNKKGGPIDLTPVDEIQ